MWANEFWNRRMLIGTRRDVSVLYGQNMATAHANKDIAISAFLAMSSHNSCLAHYLMLAYFCNFHLFPLALHGNALMRRKKMLCRHSWGEKYQNCTIMSRIWKASDKTVWVSGVFMKNKWACWNNVTIHV